MTKEIFEGNCFSCGKLGDVDVYGFCDKCEKKYAKEQEENDS